MPTIHLSSELFEEVVSRAAQTHPYECCGILIGRRVGDEHYVVRIVHAENIAAGDRRKVYQIDWGALFDAVRATRHSRERIIGFYHSHPDGSVRPSRRDAEEAWVDHSYLIVSNPPDRPRVAASWRIPGKYGPLIRETMAVDQSPDDLGEWFGSNPAAGAERGSS